MTGKISSLFREYIMGLSIVITIIGIIVTILGVICIGDFIEGIGFLDTIIDGNWSLYVLILGLIILLTGIYYFYDYHKNKNFFMDEINTNKRSEFIKRHQELKKAVKHLPIKYQTILQEKEKEFKLK